MDQAHRNDLRQPAEVPGRPGRPVLDRRRRHQPEGPQARRFRRPEDLRVLHDYDRAGRRYRPRARQHLQGQFHPAAVRRSGRAGI